MSNTPYYSNYHNMLGRCHNKKDKDFKNYGARGIAVCEIWKKSFTNFWEDMKGTYKKGLTLDRIDNNGPYSKENCRWASPVEQGNNTRNNVHIATSKGKMTVAQAALTFGIKSGTLRRRLKAGWPIHLALIIAPNKSKKLLTYLTVGQDKGS